MRRRDDVLLTKLDAAEAQRVHSGQAYSDYLVQCKVSIAKISCGAAQRARRS